MAKIRFSKGELKKQRDSLKQYKRYLPTLLLKKQQIQMEILRQHIMLQAGREKLAASINNAVKWAGLLSESGVFDNKWARPRRILKSFKNIAGVELPVFEKCEFGAAEYDLFTAPLWVDTAVEELKTIAALREEIKVLEEGVAVLRQELRITTQRVNLFEKVKIPEAEEAIRRIKIYIGDQMANAVGRSKAAKKKIEMAFAYEVSA
ncbi:MAG: V-type ATP synthase subunit D [Candidatus Omnitrophota bacterium]|jgi:V/A-type H+-transporting ATPase subunit D|nr:V-type ATP synthase subunit D [Candidatus Omnitrophota bacterium]